MKLLQEQNKSIKQLHVILKTAERCNLACSYCYFFFGGDESYLQHSPVMKPKVIQDVSEFLCKGVKDLNTSSVNIYFHGGEPLLLKKPDFDNMCSLLREKLSTIDLYLSIQTNGVLLDDDWINLFIKHKVAVGISVDGNKEIHDKFRVDHKGRGSYEKTKNGIALLKRANTIKEQIPFGALSVINTEASGEEVYHHLTHELGFDHIDFLIPDNHYETMPNNIKEVGEFLCSAFRTWAEDSNKNIRVRLFTSIIHRLLGQKSGFVSVRST